MSLSGAPWSWRRLSRTDRLETDEVGLHSIPLVATQAILAVPLVPVGPRLDATEDGSKHHLVTADRAAAAPMIPFEPADSGAGRTVGRDLARLHRLGGGESHRNKPGRHEQAQDEEQSRHGGLHVLAVIAQSCDDRLHGTCPALRRPTFRLQPARRTAIAAGSSMAAPARHVLKRT